MKASMLGALAPSLLIGCVSFASREERIVPDPAPLSEMVVVAGDTTYVLRGDGYWLLAGRRDALWRRDVLDDVAWRWRQLYGAAPSPVAVRLASESRVAPSAEWRGVPLVDADLVSGRAGRGWQQPSAELAASLARAWLRAARPAAPDTALPAWLEAGTAATLAGPEVLERIGTWRERRGVTVAELVAAPWPSSRPIAAVLALREDTLRLASHSRTIPPRTQRPTARGADADRGRELAAQAASLLAYLRERDAGVVAKLGAGIPLLEAVRGSATIPQDLAELDAAWRKWVREKAGRMRRG